ncbi:Fe-S cluster assembly protein SufD [Pararhodospirillum photometricum]|uniref:FeS assembly protein SufD n=1 Tax=Pararhodospirillum photometricum DSM 122 TaxID=1150469 RepID=H6SRY8_PARPM|nr:Fe-S cluster assembly protein SufD [Pararhodospirillum photometricum]CCG07667.1 FeS assembly protein SufD [Pararhodospirillum photometricum DSM 122]
MEGSGWLAGLRRHALEAYRRQGIPTPRVEAWKYTNLACLGREVFGPAPPVPTLTRSDLPDARLLPLTAPRVVFINGRFAPALSDPLPAGVAAGSLQAQLRTDPEAVRPLLERAQTQETLESLPLAALNLALLDDGLFLSVAEGVTVETPVHLVHLTVPGDGPSATHPRAVMVLGKNARAVIASSFVCLPGAATFTNLVSDVILEEGAQLSHARLICGAADGVTVGATLASVAAGARYETFSLTLGGRLVRNETRVRLEGEGAQALVNGAYAVRAGQHVDNTVFVDHAVPHATSSQLFKGVLDETGRAVFQGKILVRRDAQGSDGRQLHRALLLAPGAEVDIKPELQIYADDVVCGHGATAGEMDLDQLFYLQSRGLDAATARALLVEAFLDDAIGTVTDERLQEALVERVRDWQRSRAQAVWSDSR